MNRERFKGGVRPGGNGGMHAGGFLVVGLLLALPGHALVRGLGPTLAAWAGAWVVVMSTLAVGLNLLDKRRAERGGQREPETWLHLLEFLGGWPGAFLAQRWFRHKTAKISYQIVFWLIVALYQIAAVDFLRGWPWARAAGPFLSG